MSRRNTIVVTTQENGRHTEGYISGALKPGTVVQTDPTVALKGGRHTYKVYDRSADGDFSAGGIAVLKEDNLQGRTITDAYVDGDRCFVYFPLPGDELNVLVKDTAGTGTGSNPNAGDLMSVDDGSGKLVPSAGASAPFQLLEDATSAAADDLCWVKFGGV